MSDWMPVLWISLACFCGRLSWRLGDVAADYLRRTLNLPIRPLWEIGDE